MKNKATVLYRVHDVIRVVRSQRVILDSDLAKLYGVPTKRLNEAVKRNSARFPSDFMFPLNQAEVSETQRNPQQNWVSTPQRLDNEGVAGSRSQFATLNAQSTGDKGVIDDTHFSEAPSKRGKNVKHLPYAFTEHGAVMAAMVLNSPKATQMSVFIVRTFMRMRDHLLSTAVLSKRLTEIEKSMLTYDAALVDIYEQIQPLRVPPPEPERKRIGFNVNEKPEPYRARTVKKQRTNKNAQPQG